MIEPFDIGVDVSMVASLDGAIQDFLGTFKELNVPGAVKIGTRYPVVRRGEREPIDPAMRRAIWHRDRGRCQGCGTSGVLLELDHVTPWSAGGTDTSDNLRSLCHDCNTDRSNFRTIEMAPLMSVTPMCDRCLIRADDEGMSQPYRMAHHPGAEHFEAFCGCCKRRSTVTDRGRLW